MYNKLHIYSFIDNPRAECVPCAPETDGKDVRKSTSSPTCYHLAFLSVGSDGVLLFPSYGVTKVLFIFILFLID